jgi:hypothetical protein
LFSEGVYDASDESANFYLTEREPYRFRQIQDTIKHIVKQGDTLFHLAARYYRSYKRPAGLWWVIADFQPTPIVDPTLELQVGSTVFVPSIRTITEDVFDEARRQDVAEDFIV